MTDVEKSEISPYLNICLASPDAQEVMWLTYLLTYLLDVSSDLTDVTLVSDDTFRRLGTWVTDDYLSSVIESVRPS